MGGAVGADRPAAEALSRIRLCRAGEVEPETPLRVEAGGAVYAVVKAGRDFFVLADQCTHGPGKLSEGTVLGTELECPFHQGRFDLATGVPTYPPCTEAIRVWTARLEGGDIWIDPEERR